MLISASCWRSSHHSWYPSWQLKITWAVPPGMQSPCEATAGTSLSFPHRYYAKSNTSQMFFSVLGNISVAVWRYFLIFKWSNLWNVKLHGNSLPHSSFSVSKELQPCNWFSFSSDKVQYLVTLTHVDMTWLTGSSFFLLLFPSQIKEVAVLQFYCHLS